MPTLRSGLTFGESRPNNCSAEKPEAIKRLHDALKAKSTLHTRPLPLYELPLEEEIISPGLKKFSFGEESSQPNRTIIVFGETGTGRSNLINGMINYLLSVDWVDRYRFLLIDEDTTQSPGRFLNFYKINHQEGFKINHSLTIVNAQGFKNIERVGEVIENLLSLFSAERGVGEVDAVCFLTPASLPRFALSQKYLDSVLSLFGKDVAENVWILFSFTDGLQPPILQEIGTAGVLCPTTEDGLQVRFRFTNSALFAENRSAGGVGLDEGGFDQIGLQSMEMFFLALEGVDSKSLVLTREVLQERKQLGMLQDRVQAGLAKLEGIQEKAETLKVHEAEISRSQNFQSETSNLKSIEVKITGTRLHLNTCRQCKFTCHCPCRGSRETGGQRKCSVMGSDGRCTVCQGKCCWDQHFHHQYKWESEEVRESRTDERKKMKYLSAMEAMRGDQASMKRLMREFKSLQDDVETSARSLQTLREKALSTGSSLEDFNMMMEEEKREAMPGWEYRVQVLLGMRERAEILERVERGVVLI